MDHLKKLTENVSMQHEKQPKLDVEVEAGSICLFSDRFTFTAECLKWSLWAELWGVVELRANKMTGGELAAMEKPVQDEVLHLLSCSPEHVWPASNWEIQGWKDFSGRAESPVKKKKLTWLPVTSLFYYAPQPLWVSSERGDYVSSCDTISVSLPEK